MLKVLDQQWTAPDGVMKALETIANQRAINLSARQISSKFMRGKVNSFERLLEGYARVEIEIETESDDEEPAVELTKKHVRMSTEASFHTILQYELNVKY